MSDSDPLFAVVQFSELINGKKCVELLPISWLFDNEEMCYFPPKKDLTKVDKWVENQRVPGETWPSYPIAIISKARDYEQGIRRLRRSYKKKEVDSSDSEAQLQKTVEPLQLNSAGVSQALATPRPLTKGNIQDRDSVSTRKTVSTANVLDPIPENDAINIPDEREDTSEEASTLPRQPRVNSNEDISEFKAAIEDIKQFIKKEINNAKRSILYDLDQKINTLKSEISKQSTDRSVYPQPWKIISADLPANDIDKFLEFDEILKVDSEKQEALKDIFRLETIGSTNYETDISAILKKLISKSVQLQYSGCGRVINGAEKENFSATQFYKHMNDFLMSKYSESKEMLKITHATSRFFSGAKDRDGGRSQRAKKN